MNSIGSHSHSSASAGVKHSTGNSTGSSPVPPSQYHTPPSTTVQSTLRHGSTVPGVGQYLASLGP
eukprot:3872340-Rhodomonas_salina.6